VTAVATGRGTGQIAFPDDVVDRQVRPVRQAIDGLYDDLVEPLGTERATEHGEDETVSGQAELRPSRVAIAIAIDGQDLLANRCPRDAGAR
jgi:hypothetical protein